MNDSKTGLPWKRLTGLATIGLLGLGCSGNARQIRDLPPQTVQVAQVAPPPTPFEEEATAPDSSTPDQEFLASGAPPEPEIQVEAVEALEPDVPFEVEEVATFDPPPQAPAVPVNDDPTLVVIGDQESRERELSLYEASLRARQIRQNAGIPIAVIDDKNLHEFAAGGQITLVEEPIAPAASAAELSGLDADEQKWRSGARDLRAEWRQVYDEIDHLESESNRLRNEFYAEDDPFVRDNQIKPAWDRVLDRLSHLRTREIEVQAELDAFIEEGRRAGALPGWLREGRELEPPRSQPEEEDEEHDPSEPKVLEGRPPNR